MTDHERSSFGAALRDAAESFDVPRTDELRERAVRRGRQIKRRKAAGAGVSVGVALGVAGALAASLLGSGGPSQHPAAATTGVRQTAVLQVNQGLGPYMAEHLEPFLPPGAKLIRGTGTPALTGSGYNFIGQNESWEADAYFTFAFSGRHYVVDLAVVRAQDVTCATPVGRLGVCTSEPLDGGTLVALRNKPNPGISAWLYYWNVAGDASVQVQVNPMILPGSDAGTRNPFTEQQIESLVTAPAWTSTLKGLPPLVHCPDLQPYHGGGVPWVCKSTGKLYPGYAEDYAVDS